MPFDLTFTSNLPGGGSSRLPAANGQGGNFQVQMHPANPIAGEVVQFHIINTSGWGVTDEGVELGFAWDFGDPGTVYETGGGIDNDANYARGWSVAHAFATGGTKTVTVVGVKAGGDSREVTVQVNVQNRAAISWDVDLTVNNQAQFDALSVQSWGGMNRVTLADDATFNVPGSAANGYIRLSGNGRILITRSGTGSARPVIYGNGGASNNFRAFDIVGSTDVIFDGIEARGSWNPVTLTAPDGFMTFCGWTINNTNDTRTPSVSYHRCKGSGLNTFHVSAGSGYHAGTTYLSASDCEVTDWQDYGLVGHFGGSVEIGVAGCRAKQHPFAVNLVDGKTPAVGNAGEHGPWRTHNIILGGAENCDMRSTSGWSPFPPDSATQPCFRIHQPGPTTRVTTGNWRMAISRCRGVGDANFTSYGSISSGSPAHIPGVCIVDGCEYDGGSQAYAGFCFVYGLSGLRAFNNLLVRHDLHHNNGTADRNGLHGISESGLVPGANQGFSFTGFNTGAFLRNTATKSDTEAYSVLVGQTWTGTPWTENGNLIHGPGLPGAGSLPNYTVSPGDGFQLVTGSAEGINAVNSGLIPAFDFDGNVRGTTTNAGAYDTEVASATAIPAPTISGPVIARVTSIASPTTVAVNSLGTTSGLLDALLYDVQWQVNGSNTTDGLREAYEDVNGENGTLRALVGVANRGSTRVRATSNGVSV